MVTLLLTVGLVLGAGAQAEARCYDVGTPQFRCDPIVSQALRRRVESRPALSAPTAFAFRAEQLQHDHRCDAADVSLQRPRPRAAG